ncbi:MAG: FlgD immunoglobulin-like domain containing protein [bacterium]
MRNKILWGPLVGFVYSFIPTLLWCQFDWVPYENNPVIDENFDPGAKSIARPSVVFDGSTYHMWYASGRPLGIIPERGFMGYATSQDGINWTLIDPEVIAPTRDNSRFDQFDASQGWVIADKDTFKMWYWGFNPDFGELGMTSFGYAWSTDGENWTRVNGPGMFGSVYDRIMDGNLEGIGLAAPCVIKDGDAYHMWYTRVEVIPFLFRIGYATSPDGIKWTNVPGGGRDGAVLDWGDAGRFDEVSVAWPAVIRTEQGFIMWYFGADQSGVGRLGCASSTDGVNWTRVNGNGTNGACFDEAHAVSVLKTDEGYKMWYAVFDTKTVNLAFSDVGLRVEDLGNGQLPAGFALKQNYPNPFNPSTTIRFELSTSRFVTLRIYNTLGQEVRTLASGEYAGGKYEIAWDGSDDAGQHVTSGVYFLRMGVSRGKRGTDFVQVRKIVLMK